MYIHYIYFLQIFFFCGFTVATKKFSSWEGIERFEKFGYDVLPCPTYQRSQCCICKSVVKQIETLIKNPSASRDYEVDAYGFRMDRRQSSNRKRKEKIDYPTR